MEMPPEHIVARLAQHGQSHVLAHWDTLSSDQQQSLILQIDSIDYSRLLTSLKSSLAADAALQSPASRRALLPASNVAARAARTPEASSAWRSLGLDLLRDGKCAVVLLAGGQGTRLGSSAPKGCYDIGLPSRKSLFELHADRMRTVQALAGPTARPLRWYIMTSDATDRETKAFFEQHAFFGLRREQVVFFPQGTMPALTPEGKLILATPGEIAMAPDGNGGLYRSLEVSGALDDMEAHGVACVDCVAVDNALARPADPEFLGYCWSQGAEVGARVCLRRGPEERVGVFVESEGNPRGIAVREYSELGAADASVRECDDDPSGPPQLKFRWANLCMQYMTVAFLRNVARTAVQEGSTYHVAWKSIPSVEGPVRGIKLEQFIFDPFPSAQSAALFEVLREEEFAPVKNAPGAAEDSPETAQALVLALEAKIASS